ncbi:hypothetical protein VB715_06195 [Crocosphaera sp. UHCC 0190]|uniref:hypothetical protein n=1 Tax=Crocosphaera sp. UHCC 0190 TaxID=3110246 RepID=UPI002B1ECC99|nr:hypothetical protein [Crocosphaera sp. UHCC 0190]MEA5509352.1 hypothetical protein [Crocosphaera sp. UHCC 0190]
MKIMGVTVDLNLWATLALDTCPDCENHGLTLNSQAELAAILACPKCGATYWISPIRNRGAWKINTIDQQLF